MRKKMKVKLIGVSDNICKIRELISKVAEVEISAVVCGETGVGKELVVQNLHQKSKRAGMPFVKVNCAALPDTLLESEMFGYERGAFTGAQRKMRGKFEQAHNGVLFLDEIGDMSIGLQSKLLHALQDGTFTPLGSEKGVKTDAWVIAATNHDLPEDLKIGKFRQDLYFRLNCITIHIEPLRKRPEDIPYLIEHYVEKYASSYNGNRPKALNQRIVDKLVSYNWPGNVRELQNVLKRLMVFGVSSENIDEMLTGGSNYSAAPQLSASTLSLLSDYLNSSGGKMPELSDLPLKKIRKEAGNRVEKAVIGYVLDKTGWNRSKASRILDVSYRSLLDKIQELEVSSPALFQ
jgi:transcriptional regulator with PAS, ATPase and Fis domain